MLEEFGCELIGATADAIDKAENRDRFDKAMKKIGLETPNAEMAHSMEEAFDVLDRLGFPCIIRPSFTMGGSGGGIAYNKDEFEEICTRGLDLSPTNELLIDESLIGWKEYEMEVVRDKNDNCIIICSIENFDAMGVHTGDSITVAPAQTLTDKEYQHMRDAALMVIRAIGVETGGSNIQFAIDPDLEATVMRCLAKEPQERFSGMEALATALSFSGGSSTAASSLPGSGDFRRPRLSRSEVSGVDPVGTTQAAPAPPLKERQVLVDLPGRDLLFVGLPFLALQLDKLIGDRAEGPLDHLVVAQRPSRLDHRSGACLGCSV